MKKIFAILFLATFVFSSCKKSTTSYNYTGTIEGYSPFMTQCGGLYWIEINGVDARTTFNSLPANSNINLTNATFPINVKLNWHYQQPDNCSIIIIDAIEKEN